jgi:hypothetical protein
MQRILFVGLGGLGSCLFDLITRLPGKLSFLVGGRNLVYLQQRTNLSRFAALQLGLSPEITCTQLDLSNIEQTAEIITQFQPDIIVCAATLQRTEAIHDLPAPLAAQLAAAQLGPRLPLHLTLIYRLMQAVNMTGHSTTVLNAVYPDVVGPVLSKVGLAPTTGIGDLANNIPALRYAIALQLGASLTSIDVRLVMARSISYRLSHMEIKDAPLHMTVLLDGEDCTHLLDMKRILGMLHTELKRTGGTTGLLMTAASGAVMMNALMNHSGMITHAPGPNGLPGGYPVHVSRQGVEVMLPHNISLEKAFEINEAGLRLDGIERIDDDGTVYFAEQNMLIFKHLLGYECWRMPLAEVEEWAKELHAKYHILASKYQ